jgi:hypothetical protein
VNDGDDTPILPHERGKRAWTSMCAAIHWFHRVLEPGARDPHFSGPA